MNNIDFNFLCAEYKSGLKNYFGRILRIIFVYFVSTGGSSADNIDILGIKIGSSLHEANKIVKDHFKNKEVDIFYLNSDFEQPEYLHGSRLEDYVFRNGIMYIFGFEPTTEKEGYAPRNSRGFSGKNIFSEAIVLFYDEYSEDQEILSIFRSIDLESFSISGKDIERALVEKYGSPHIENRIGLSLGTSIVSIDRIWTNTKFLDYDKKSNKYYNNKHIFEKYCLNSKIGFDVMYQEHTNHNHKVWFDERNRPMEFYFWFSTEDLHRRNFIERIGNETREEWISEYKEKMKKNQNGCGEVLYSRSNELNQSKDPKKITTFLYDVKKIVDESNKRIKE